MLIGLNQFGFVKSIWFNFNRLKLKLQVFAAPKLHFLLTLCLEQRISQKQKLFCTAHLHSSSGVWDLLYLLISALNSAGIQQIRRSYKPIRTESEKIPNKFTILLHFWMLSSSKGQHNWQHKTFCYRLPASKNRCIITTDVLAPVVYLVASKCQFLKTKIIVSESSRAELQWFA